MSLRRFEYALAVAEAGSVTAAAELLHVAQPSVSQQIRVLERKLGATLFDRTPSGLVPTDRGRDGRDWRSGSASSECRSPSGRPVGYNS